MTTTRLKGRARSSAKSSPSRPWQRTKRCDAARRPLPKHVQEEFERI
jgi:hypothetical protein